MGLLDRFKTGEAPPPGMDKGLDRGLDKTRTGFLGKIRRAVRGKKTVDDDVLDALEEALIASDAGVAATLKIIDRIRERVAEERYVSSEELQGLIRDEIASLLLDNAPERPAGFDAPLPNRPHVIMVVGVNGVGKTTTIGKMARRYRDAGKSVLLGAGDTFRAAAAEQLSIWAERADAPLVRQAQGSDPASVAYDTVASARARNADVAIVDTAGRLHTRGGLMDELAKIRRAMAKCVDGAPHEVLLVLDASTGQNALRQAEEFARSVEVTGIAVTKLDGTAKGGVVIGISSDFRIPVKYIGVGERIEDLEVFDRRAFVDALFG